MNTSRQITPDRGRVVAVLVAVLLLAGLATEFVLSADRGNWQPAYQLAYSGAMALVPFLLARLVPAAAGFDAQWLPSSRRHWAWFLGMFVFSFVVKLLVVALALVIIGPSPPESPGNIVSAPIGILFEAIAAILIGPLAEEIFFRGYLLEQLRKLMRSSAALLAQAFLFGLVHLYTWGVDPLSLFNSLDAILFALIVGLWRIRFRSLLPIVLVHILGNAPGISLYVEAYNHAVSLATAPNATGMADSDKNVVDRLMESAGTFARKGDYPSAMRELNKLIDVEPEFYPGHYWLAWIYATCPDQGCRDGEKALFHATRSASMHLEDPAGKEAYWNDWACLAAAHAERGDFEKAIENQKKAMECLPTVSEEWRPRIEARVKACMNLYRARKPLRTNAISLGGLSDKWVESMSHPGPEGFPEIAE